MSPRFLVAAAVLAAACAHAPARGPRLRSAVAEGWAPVVKADPPGTKRRALAAALRAAVEKTSGVHVSGRTRVTRAVAVEDELTARSAGVVKSYEILSDTEADGFHKTVVRALVDLDPAPDGAVRPEPPPGDPKVAVSVSGPNGDDAAAAVRRELLSRGFTVVDGPAADITVRGEVAVSDLGYAGPWNSARARLTLEARQAGSGRVLWSASREASGIGAALASADSKASETAGRLGGEELAREVAARLSD
ncbi:MAG: hypothetical protein KGL74_14380 [Elusimicrobia bacterium]|nr:hypothetical protein [Elusimicrobiota bacterium]